MRLSAFNQYVADFPEAGDTLVHNTFSGGFAVLDAETIDALRAADRGEALTAMQRELSGDPDWRDRDVAIVVESREQEEADYRAWFAKRRAKPRFQAIVGVNLACNFDCPYCVQAEVMDGSVMKPHIADATADWIAERATTVGAEEIHLAFVGGEPLLHPERIERIASRVRAAMSDEVSLSFGLITNGYFLTDDMVERLLPHGLVNAQVTFDGDETTHHLSRVHKKGENTFRRILDNVSNASRNIRITINGNYQENTVAGFEPLLDELVGQVPSGTKIKFSPALEALASVEGAGYGSCTWSGADHDHMLPLHDAIVRHGFDTIAVNAVGPCAFHDVDNYAIDPSGRIFKCPGFIGYPDWAIGTVDAGLDTKYQRMLAHDTQQTCGSCSHRPNCAGGCVAAEWVAKGSATGTNCERDYFDAVERDAVIRQFHLATSDSPISAADKFPALKREVPDRAAGCSPERAVRTPALRVLA
jgi:uncharacterized protein